MQFSVPTISLRLRPPLTRGEIDQLHSLMAEPLDLLELLAAPQRNASLMERGQVGAFRGPADVRFRPALKEKRRTCWFNEQCSRAYRVKRKAVRYLPPSPRPRWVP